MIVSVKTVLIYILGVGMNVSGCVVLISFLVEWVMPNVKSISIENNTNLVNGCVVLISFLVEWVMLNVKSILMENNTNLVNGIAFFVVVSNVGAKDSVKECEFAT